MVSSRFFEQTNFEQLIMTHQLYKYRKFQIQRVKQNHVNRQLNHFWAVFLQNRENQQSWFFFLIKTKTLIVLRSLSNTKLFVWITTKTFHYYQHSELWREHDLVVQLVQARAGRHLGPQDRIIASRHRKAEDQVLYLFINKSQKPKIL